MKNDMKLNNKTIYQLFETQVSKTPDAIAAVFGQHSLTYRELNQKAGQLAWELHMSKVEKNTIIGIMAERSLEMLIGIYGILKYGAAYMPISPDYPEKRVDYIVSDSQPSCLIGQNKMIHRLSKYDIVCVDLDDQGIYDLPEYRNTNLVKDEDVMYVIYTSGSTGNPKGVMVEHRSVVNRLVWMQDQYPITCQDTILQKTPFVFDVSVWELFWWAITGAKVCMLQPGYEKFPQGIIQESERSQITVMHFVPSMFYSFLNYIGGGDYAKQLSSIGYIFCSGEALTPIHVKEFNRFLGQKNNTQLINLYGPTEATVDVTYYNCPREGEISNVPIGKPITNTAMYVLDEQSLLLPDGEKGELCIAGIGLARGYLNRPELTAEKFITAAALGGERLYRTGDYACFLPDGNIEYLGRIDNQIKIRGLRIELGEIETRICEYESVSQCIVVIENAQQANVILKAYILSADHTLNTTGLKQFLKMILPDYMIPNQYEIVDSFPVTTNGKIDRKALEKMITS